MFHYVGQLADVARPVVLLQHLDHFRRQYQAEAAQRKIAEDQRAIAEAQKRRAEANFRKARQAVDDYFTLVSEMPHGGFKRSGYGKDLSVYALEDYTVPRHVMVKFA